MNPAAALEELRQQSLERVCIDKSLWYPSRAFGISIDRDLAPVFLQYGKETAIFDSISFTIDAVRDCLAKPLFKLDATMTSYYFETYFKTSEDYFFDGARLSINLTSERFAEAAELFGPAPATRALIHGRNRLARTDGLAELTKARKQADFLTLCVNDICRLLDTDAKPKAFFQSALFKSHHAARRANLPKPRFPRFNAHKVIRFGAKR
jgi:hypothetical protein